MKRSNKAIDKRRVLSSLFSKRSLDITYKYGNLRKFKTRVSNHFTPIGMPLISHLLGSLGFQAAKAYTFSEEMLKLCYCFFF